MLLFLTERSGDGRYVPTCSYNTDIHAHTHAYFVVSVKTRRLPPLPPPSRCSQTMGMQSVVAAAVCKEGSVHVYMEMKLLNISLWGLGGSTITVEYHSAIQSIYIHMFLYEVLINNHMYIEI